MRVKTEAVIAEYKLAHKTLGLEHTAYVLRSLIERGLSRQQASVYDIICKKKRVISQDVTDRLGIRAQHTINILNILVDLDLIKKTPVVEHSGLHYLWELAAHQRPSSKDGKLYRARFLTNPDDFRPVLWPIPHPYWCTGFNLENNVVVAYADDEAYVLKYWPDAEKIDMGEPVEGYSFSSRFLKPDWFEEGARNDSENA